MLKNITGCFWRREVYNKVANNYRYTAVVAASIARWAIEDLYNDAGCAMRIFPKSLGREIAKHTPFLYGTAHCFYPTIAKIYGLRIVEVPINHNRRNHGDSKFGLMRGRLIEGFLSCLYIKKVKKIKIQFEE